MPIPPPLLPKVVKDWDGFEELVADMHRTGTVSVLRDAKLFDVYGAPHQIDVLVTHKQGLHEHKTIIECKYWNTKIKRTHVDAMAHSMSSLGVAKGAFFTTMGFQSGAKKVAEKIGIGIFTVRELAENEWGGPARVWDFWLQFVYRAFAPLTFQGKIVVQPGQPVPTIPSFNLRLGKENPTSTPIFNAGGEPKEDTLENLLDRATLKVIEQHVPLGSIAGDGDRRIAYRRIKLNMPFDLPLQIKLGESWLTCPKIEFDLGVKIEQVRYVYDRADAFVYALAVENCINGESHALGRRHKSKTLDFNPIWPLPDSAIPHSTAPDPPVAGSEIAKKEEFKNGSVVRLVTAELFDMKEIDEFSSNLAAH